MMRSFKPFSRLALISVLTTANMYAPVTTTSAHANPLESLGAIFVPQENDRLETTLAGILQEDARAVQKVVKDYEAVVLFYEARKFKPLWVGPRGPYDAAQEMTQFVQASWTHGLNPYRYHYDALALLMTRDDLKSRAELELLLTDAYIRLGQDLSGIRINPSSLDTQKKYWKQPYDAQTLLAPLAEQSDPDIGRFMGLLAPQGATYKALQKELIRLSEAAPQAYEAALPIRIQGLLHPYQRHAAVPALRLRMGLPEKSGDAALVYDDALAAAVLSFQRAHHIKQDGIVGGQTLELLNRTQSQKIRQVIANLERLRWVDENKPDKFVVVNIPSATLWAVEGGNLAFDMPVIVGRKQRPTNTFITNITGVRFNPNWTVPPTIKREDILPKLVEDPNYLSQKGMELIQGYGEDAMSIDPASVDWANMTESDLGRYRMVQIPGAHNPLGQVRLLMPNVYNIYLHDTNQPEYFNHAARAESSGCVRMSDPLKMAAFVMESKAGWSEEKTEAVLARGKTSDIAIDQGIPVYMLYYTVWVNDSGDIVYGNDLYDYDTKLIKMLENIDGIFIPVLNNKENG